MTTNIISPFSGSPETRQTIDDEGNPSFVVTPQELTPFRARVADGLGMLSAIGLTVCGFMIAESSSTPEDFSWWVFEIGPFFGYPLYQGLWRLFLRKHSELLLSIDQFEVRTWRGWNSYDRQVINQGDKQISFYSQHNGGPNMYFIIRLIAWSVWGLVGLILWIPFLIRAMVSFNWSLVYATVTGHHYLLAQARANLDFATSLYVMGFRNIEQ